MHASIGAPSSCAITCRCQLVGRVTFATAFCAIFNNAVLYYKTAKMRGEPAWVMRWKCGRPIWLIVSADNVCPNVNKNFLHLSRPGARQAEAA